MGTAVDLGWPLANVSTTAWQQPQSQREWQPRCQRRKAYHLHRRHPLRRLVQLCCALMSSMGCTTAVSLHLTVMKQMVHWSSCEVVPSAATAEAHEWPLVAMHRPLPERHQQRSVSGLPGGEVVATLLCSHQRDVSPRLPLAAVQHCPALYEKCHRECSRASR